MTQQKKTVELSRQQLMYLRNTSFLSTSLVHLIASAKPLGDRYQLPVSRDTAEMFRSAFTDRLAKVGLDINYEPTIEGKVLEELIDRFYFG